MESRDRQGARRSAPSFATISSGRCFFRRLVIESLLASRAVDLHTDWIRISKAGHLRNQFEHLLVYLDDGLMPIDNNETEQLMKPLALGRTKWMFIGSVAAGYRAADLMSLVSSAHRNDLDIFVYVKDVLDQLLAGETNYDVLRPDVLKQSNPEAIRIYRAEDRQTRAEAKAVKRARRRIAKRA